MDSVEVNEGDLRPEGLPDQFKSVGDLATSYNELRSKMDSGSGREGGQAEVAVAEVAEVTQDTQATEATTVEPGTAQLTTQAQTTPATVGMPQERLQEISDVYMSSGTLGDAERAELDAAFGPAVVNQYLDGFSAQSELHVNKVLDTAGGQDNYARLANWVATNIPDAERQAFDATVDSRDTVAAVQAVEAMRTRMAESVGQAPESMVGGTRGVDGPKPFQHQAEQLAMQADPRYRDEGPVGESFRAEFIKRLEVTGDYA